MEAFRIGGGWIRAHGERIFLTAAGLGIAAILIQSARDGLFAGLHARSRKVYRKEVDRRRRKMFAEIQSFSDGSGDHRPLNIVEIGTAIVQNAPYYPTNAEITCVTTATYRNAEIDRLEDEYPYVRIVYGSPETMTSLDDNTVDVVVSMLSLCSVEDVEQTATEIRRILKKNGRFYFLEHVAAKDSTSQVRNHLSLWWGSILYGCKPDRKLLKILKKSGFKTVEIDDLTVDINTGSDRYVGSVLNEMINRFFTYLIGPHVIGVAIK